MLQLIHIHTNTVSVFFLWFHINLVMWHTCSPAYLLVLLQYLSVLITIKVVVLFAVFFPSMLGFFCLNKLDCCGKSSLSFRFVLNQRWQNRPNKIDLAAARILLSQGESSLERYTQDFLDLYHLVHNDDSLCVFFQAGSQRWDESASAWRQTSRELSVGSVPLWILLYHRLDGPPYYSPHFVPPTATIPTDIKPKPSIYAELTTPELETTSVPVGILEEYEGMKWSPVPSDIAPLTWFEDMEDNCTKPVSSPSTENYY